MGRTALTDHDDVRRFLADAIALRSAAGPRLSPRSLAREAGLANPTLVNAVIAGTRTLPLDAAKAMVGALRLDEEETEIFLLLAESARVEAEVARWAAARSTAAGAANLICARAHLGEICADLGRLQARFAARDFLGGVPAAYAVRWGLGSRDPAALPVLRNLHARGMAAHSGGRRRSTRGAEMCYGLTEGVSMRQIPALCRELQAALDDLVGEWGRPRSGPGEQHNLELCLFPLTAPLGGASVPERPPDTDAFPDVYSVLDPVIFLTDALAARQAQARREGQRYSSADLARDAGQSDARIVSKILTRDQGLTEARALAFAAGLGMAAEEGRHLALLARLAATRDPPAADRLLREIARDAAAARSRTLRPSRLRALRDAHVWVLHELVRCAGFQDDDTWVASALRPPISRAQAAIARASLLDTGLLVRVAEGIAASADHLEVLCPARVTEPDPTMFGYHQGMKTLALRALEEAEADDAAFAFAGHRLRVPAGERSALDAALARAAGSLHAWFGAAPGPLDRVVQVHLHAFSLEDVDEDV